jgi:hypothetical protein
MFIQFGPAPAFLQFQLPWLVELQEQQWHLEDEVLPTMTSILPNTQATYLQLHTFHKPNQARNNTSLLAGQCTVDIPLAGEEKAKPPRPQQQEQQPI